MFGFWRIVFLVVFSTIGLASAAIESNISKCNKPYQYFNGFCVAIFQSQSWLNWWQVKQKCMNEHKGRMVVIDTKEKQDVIVQLMDNTGTEQSIPIGATSLGNADNKFYWDSTGVPLGYTAWHKGEPNNTGGKEHCVILGFRKEIGRLWIDMPCEKEYTYYACEKIISTCAGTKNI